MEVTLNLKDELSSAGMRPGVPSVMGSGQLLMLMWLADSLDLHQQVSVALDYNKDIILIHVISFFPFRSNCTCQCLLWSGNWSHFA